MKADTVVTLGRESKYRDRVCIRLLLGRDPFLRTSVLWWGRPWSEMSNSAGVDRVQR